jgi:diphthamide synthase (EF-2-diphthine--ammonia ligase)
MMNERIQNLAEQAGAVKYEADWKRDSYPVNLAELEKFAELIVRECLFIIDDERKPEMVSQIELWKQIKEHFGVE